MNGYDAAVQMITYEGRVIWTSFRALLETHMFIIAISGVVYNYFPDFNQLRWILPVLGIILCIMWLLITLRQFDYYKYWHAWAREIETTTGGLPRMISTGRSFSDGNDVTIGGDSMRLGWWSRLFRVRFLIYAIIMGFIVIYIFILVRAI